MAGKEEAEHLPTPGDEKMNAATDKEEATAIKVAKKKVAKKRAAKKKVVKKRAATKKIVAKKAAAVEAASSAYKAVVQETGQGVVEADDREKRSEPGDSVVPGEPLDTAVKGGIKQEIPVATGPSELPQEEKVTMSVEASKTTRPSAVAGFWPKVIIWVVVVLAAFMYIRSLAHKGQTVKRSESSTPAVMNQTRVDTNTTSIEENRSSAGDAAISQSTKSEPSSVGMVGEAAIEKETESKIPSAESDSQTVVSVESGQAVEGAEKASASEGQQVTIEPEPAVQEDKSPTAAAGLVSIQANDSEKEPTAPTATMDSTESPGSADTTADQVAAEYPPGGGAESQSLTVDKVSDMAVGSEQNTTSSTAVNEPSAADDEMRKTAVQALSPEASATAAVAEDSAAATSVPADAAQHTGASSMADMAAASAAASLQRKRPELARDSGRPSFKELFGYERPKPPVRWQDRGSYESFAPDSFDQQGFYPTPWPYAPRQPVWGGREYPGQYGPYGNYGAYPAYPGMPDWAPYQPYGYGSGY